MCKHYAKVFTWPTSFNRHNTVMNFCGCLQLSNKDMNVSLLLK